MQTFRVKNFERFQHYKDRAPPWIKLYNELLDDYEFGLLPDATKMHLVAIWLLASRSENKIPYDAKWVARRINANSEVDLSMLVDRGFLLLNQHIQGSEHVASKMQAECLSREEGQVQHIDSEANASGADAPPDPAIPEKEYFLRGREVLGPKSGAMIANLLKAKGKNVALARAALEQASTKQNPLEFVAAICRGPPPAKASTVHQQRQAEGRAILDELHEFNTGTGSRTNPGLLRHDSGDGSQGVRGGAGGNLIELSPSSDRPRG
jgi:hypothetical protein